MSEFVYGYTMYPVDIPLTLINLGGHGVELMKTIRLPGFSRRILKATSKSLRKYRGMKL